MLKTNKQTKNEIQHLKSKIIASSPISSWQTEGEKVKTVTNFIFLGSKITVDIDCSHYIERHLLLGKKAMINLDSILKSRDITFPTKVHIVKAMVFLLEKATAAHSSTLAWKIPRTEELF